MISVNWFAQIALRIARATKGAPNKGSFDFCYQGPVDGGGVQIGVGGGFPVWTRASRFVLFLSDARKLLNIGFFNPWFVFAASIGSSWEKKKKKISEQRLCVKFLLSLLSGIVRNCKSSEAHAPSFCQVLPTWTLFTSSTIEAGMFRRLKRTCTDKILRNEKSAQRGSFRPDVPADIWPKTSVRPSKSKKNKHLGTDTPRGRPRKNFGLKNFGLIFSFPKYFGAAAPVRFCVSVRSPKTWVGCVFQIPNHLGAHIRCLQGLDTHI